MCVYLAFNLIYRCTYIIIIMSVAIIGDAVKNLILYSAANKWYGVVWCGVVWCGVVWYGMVIFYLT